MRSAFSSVNRFSDEVAERVDANGKECIAFLVNEARIFTASSARWRLVF